MSSKQQGLENITKYFQNSKTMFEFESSASVLKLDYDLLDYSLYCRELGEIRPYLYTREYDNILTVVMYIEPKNYPKNYYKVKLFKDEGKIPAVDNSYLLGKCTINKESYYVSIPRHP